MEKRGILAGMGATVVLIGGVFAGLAAANAEEAPGTPAPAATVAGTATPTAVPTAAPAPVVTEEEPAVVAVAPAPVAPAPVAPAPVEAAPAPPAVVEDVPIGDIPAPAVDPYANPANVRPTPPSADVDQP